MPETSSSFIENALIKARNAASQSQLPALADDSGLEVEVLDGEPGIYSARYAGENASDEENIIKLLKAMESHTNRKANFCCAMVFVRDAQDSDPVIIERRWYGEILKTPIGKNGFGYDPIFIPEGYSKTFAELGKEIKNTISHRSKAFRYFISHFKAGF